MIDLKTENGIAVVTIKHGKANALDIELCEALGKCFEELRSSSARAVVVTGQGRMFSAGVDLLRVSAGGPDYVRKLLPVLHRSFDAVFFHPQPVVAAINGHAIAGGCVLACCADRRIMARGAGRIGVTELLVGVPFPALAFEAVRFAVPARYLAEFMFGDDEALIQIDMSEYMEKHNVSRLIGAPQLSPAAFSQTKMQLRQEIGERLKRSAAATDKIATEIWAAPQTLHYIGEYVARTLKKT